MTGLPWAATIPLTALLTRTLVIFPFEYYSRKAAINGQWLAPQMVEAEHLAQQMVAQANLNKTASEKNKLKHADQHRLIRRLRKEYRIQKWKTYLIFMRFPIGLVVMETLRRMAGTEEGMLGLVWKSITGGHRLNSGTSDVAVIPIETSFVAEGMLWFPNLLLPDPSLLLPFMLSATLLTSTSYFGLYLQNPLTRRVAEPAVAVLVNKKAYGLRMSRFQKVLALAAGPATLQFPSAMVLYWISSGLCSIGLKIFLHRWMPKEEKAAPTKRTIAPVKQQFRGPTMQHLRDQKNRKKQEQKK